MVLSYNIIKSKPHFSTRTFLQWVYCHTMTNVCITFFSPDYSHNHSVYKHYVSINNVLSWIVGNEVTLNTLLLTPTFPNQWSALGFFHWFLFCFGGLLCFVFLVGKETIPLKIMRIKMLNFLNITGLPLKFWPRQKGFLKFNSFEIKGLAAGWKQPYPFFHVREMNGMAYEYM